MRVLYLDCGMGAAGDMLTAALYELLDDNEKEKFIENIKGIGLSDVESVPEKMTKCGIVGTHMKVLVHGNEELDHGHSHEHDGHEHSHDHSHNHEEHEHANDHDHGENHTHHHSSREDIYNIINGLNVSDKVKSDAINVYEFIAEAESVSHGVPVTDIHFHEVGTLDAIIDVTSVCLLMEMLKVDKVICSSVHVGSGHVHCAHGILPVPAPATAYILREVPIYGGGVNGELCTPTGAALLKYFVSEYAKMPEIKVERIGYGMGKKDFTAANCVRAFVGKMSDEGSKIVELSCNLDDMTPEKIGFAMEVLLENGAFDVYTTPIGMKKSRPGIMLSVLCNLEIKDKMVGLIFKHTSTLGIREQIINRYTLNRSVDTVETPVGTVRVKKSEGFGIVKTKYEYDDIVRIAKEKNLSIDEVQRCIESGKNK